MADPLVCYLASNNVITSTNQYFACGTSNISGAKAQSCCNAGDYCMQDSICHYTRGGVTNGTGYYMSGCTDSTWQDPACPKQCTSEYKPDIIYDRSTTEWRCCDSTADTLDCQDPSELVVEAPDPQQLSTILQLSATPAPSSTVATSITSITSRPNTTTATQPNKTTDTSAPTSSHNSDSASDGLSAGASAGIAIAGIAIGVIVIGLFLYYRIRSPKPKNEAKKHKSEESRVIPPNPFRPSGAFTALSSEPNSALPSPKLQPQGVSRRDSEFPISLHDPDISNRKSRYSYEVDIGPYEMESPAVHQRAPYERPLSAQELEGTRVQVQELDAAPSKSGLGIDTPAQEVVVNTEETMTPDKDK